MSIARRPAGRERIMPPTAEARLAPIAAPAAGARRTIAFDPWVILAFLYPFSQLVMFELVGQLYLIDLLAAPMLLLLLGLPDSAARLRRIRPILILLGLWLAGQVATDLINGSAPADYLRGWAKIVFFGMQLVTLWLWLPRRRLYFVAFAIGLGMAAYFGVPEDYAGYEWKFGYDRALVYVGSGLLILASTALPRLRYLGPALFLAMSLFLLLQAARSAFGILFVAAVIVALALLFGRAPALRQRLSGGVFALMLLAGTAVATGAMTIYGQAVEEGELGRDALVKYRDQTSGEVPLLLGGRTESLVSMQAIADSPILGHGSWARDPYYVGLHHAIKVQLGLPVFDSARGKNTLIPSHSHLFGAWVEGGLGGGLFWLWVLTLPLAALFHLFKRNEPLAPLIAYCAVALTWSVLFSPFGSTERVFVAFQLSLLLWTMQAGGDRFTLFAPLRAALARRGGQSGE